MTSSRNCSTGTEALPERTAERDHWIRLFNRLEGAISRWREELVAAGGPACAFDEALIAAHERVLRDAASGRSRGDRQ